MSFFAIAISKVILKINKNSGKVLSLNFLHKINEEITNTVETDGIIFYCPNITTLKRFKAYGREQDTFSWIDNYIKEEDILFDIGACIGEMSLYAAKKRKANVFAFEPSSLNYSILYQNIFLNSLDDRISALNVALSDQNHISSLIYDQERFIAGKSVHHFSEVNSSIKKVESPEFRQTTIGYTVDRLIEEHSLPIPNHIKIDVDGNEHKIIVGSKDVLKSSELKTIACEFNEEIPEHHEMIKTIEEFGFKIINSISTENNKEVLERDTQNLFYVR